MKQINLEPHEYRSTRSRKNANFHGLMALVALGFLGWVWSTRADLSTDMLFGGAAFVGGCAGAGLIVFLNQWRGV